MCGEFKAFVEIQNVYLKFYVKKKGGGIVYGIKIFNKQYSNLELYKKTKYESFIEIYLCLLKYDMIPWR